LIERYVANVPNEPEGWFLRGDMRAASGQHERGAEDYTQGIARATSPRPEHFLRRARFLAAIPNVDSARVVAALDEGIARIGPVISLVDYALTLELEQKDYPRALKRIATVLERAPRREGWLLRQGNVLVLAGRTAEAIESYRAALAAIAELPERYRDTVPMEKLARDAHSALVRLGAKS
jgi:tetratricopeptide (TPR) repeat protein